MGTAFCFTNMQEPLIYLQYQIQIEPGTDAADLLIAELSLLGIEGFEEGERQLTASGKKEETDAAAIELLLKNQGLTFTVAEVAQQNWNALWESSFEPVLIEDFAAVRAAFHAPVTTVLHELIITPKMSFGTGHHATTWLMVKEMSTLDFSGKTVFDFGTGTGVLAILAAKLGATHVFAIDNDSWSIDNAIENVAVNAVAGIELQLADQVPGGKTYPIVLANINKHVIMAHLAAMKAITEKGGTWLLSGLLTTDEVDVRTAVEAMGLQWQHTLHKDGWISMRFADTGV